MAYRIISFRALKNEHIRSGLGRSRKEQLETKKIRGEHNLPEMKPSPIPQMSPQHKYKSGFLSILSTLKRPEHPEHTKHPEHPEHTRHPEQVIQIPEYIEPPQPFYEEEEKKPELGEILSPTIEKTPLINRMIELLKKHSQREASNILKKEGYGVFSQATISRRLKEEYKKTKV
jgi:hypothetical protein